MLVTIIASGLGTIAVLVAVSATLWSAPYPVSTWARFSIFLWFVSAAIALFVLAAHPHWIPAAVG